VKVRHIRFGRGSDLSDCKAWQLDHGYSRTKLKPTEVERNMTALITQASIRVLPDLI